MTVAAPPFSETVTLATEIAGPSLSVIVTTLCASMIVRFEAFDKFTVNVSSASSVASSMIGTVKVLEVSPAANVAVIEPAV